MPKMQTSTVTNQPIRCASTDLGRPKKMTEGRRRNIYIDDESWESAQKLGGGNASDGIRIALKYNSPQ